MWSHDRPGFKGAALNIKGTVKHDVLSWSPHLAKLNSKCHKLFNYFYRN